MLIFGTFSDLARVEFKRTKAILRNQGFAENSDGIWEKKVDDATIQIAAFVEADPQQEVWVLNLNQKSRDELVTRLSTLEVVLRRAKFLRMALDASSEAMAA